MSSDKYESGEFADRAKYYQPSIQSLVELVHEWRRSMAEDGPVKCLTPSDCADQLMRVLRRQCRSCGKPAEVFSDLCGLCKGPC